MNLSEEIKQKAVELGFNLVGITTAEPLDAEQINIFREWINRGFSAGLSFMLRNLEKRTNPAELLEGAKSVIVAGLNYKPSLQQISPDPVTTGRIASYALYEDYHDFIKKRLYQLAEHICTASNENTRFKICVDSSPLAERSFAYRAGLGFIGKSHILINKVLGPQLLLGEIVTSLELDSDNPQKGDCGDCRKCIDACPTGALRDDGWFDAGKCISYLTIENKAAVSSELTGKTGNYLFGCDECILACPYYEKAPLCSNKEFKYNPHIAQPDLNEILNLTQEAFDENFSCSPIRRIGLEKLKQNAKVCLQNINGKKPSF